MMATSCRRRCQKGKLSQIILIKSKESNQEAEKHSKTTIQVKAKIITKTYQSTFLSMLTSKFKITLHRIQNKITHQ